MERPHDFLQILPAKHSEAGLGARVPVRSSPISQAHMGRVTAKT